MRTRIPTITLLSLLSASACQLSSSTADLHALTERSLNAVVPAAQADPIAESATALEDAAAEAVPAVVFIRSTGAVEVQQQEMPFIFGPRGLFGGQMPGGRQLRQGAGSGVLIDKSGLILTNNHVIEGADDLEVTLSDGRHFDAEVVGTDAPTDIAVIRLKGKVPTDLPTLAFGDSDKVRLGQVVLAIGAPFALRGSVSMGIISARGRAGMGLANYENFIQTDAAINPGNSGGALVSLDGKLIGINSAISSRGGGFDGIGFAVPSNLAADIMQRLVADGRVIRGFLGVGIQDIDPSFADTFGFKDGVRGALVSHVEPGTPADNAGIKVGDVITAVNDAPVASANTLRNTVSLLGAGKTVRLELLRDGTSSTVRAKLAPMPGDKSAGSASSDAADGGLLSGARLASVSEVANRLGPNAPAAGAVIVALEPGSAADRAGLAVGDVIVQVDRAPVTSPREAMHALQGKSKAMVLVQRGDQTHFVFLE